MAHTAAHSGTCARTSAACSAAASSLKPHGDTTTTSGFEASSEASNDVNGAVRDTDGG